MWRGPSDLTSLSPSFPEAELTVPSCVLWKQHFKCLMHKRIESRDSERYVYSDIYSSIIHNSRKVEATQVPRQQLNVVCSCSGIIFHLQKEVLIHATV